jgi:hypothetical protein
MVVYEVYHIHPDPAYENVDSTFHIGVFSSRSVAQEMIDYLRPQPGFADYPDGFVVEETIVDQTRFEDGFTLEPSELGGTQPRRRMRKNLRGGQRRNPPQEA